MDEEELKAFLEGLKYRVKGIIHDIERFEKELEKE